MQIMNFRLLDLRVEKNLTQTQVAHVLNVSQETYSRYENGRVNIPIESLITLASLYQTSIDYIVRLTNIKSPNKRAQVQSNKERGKRSYHFKLK